MRGGIEFWEDVSTCSQVWKGNVAQQILDTVSSSYGTQGSEYAKSYNAMLGYLDFILKAMVKYFDFESTVGFPDKRVDYSVNLNFR